MSLQGKTILITRQPEQSIEFVAELQKRGAKAVVIPMIRIADPDSWVRCDDALRNIGSYDAIVFTSSNGVKKVLERYRALGLDQNPLKKKKLYAVGAKTAEALGRHSLTASLGADTYSADALISFFRGSPVSGLRMLLPKGNLGRDELSEALTEMGAVVQSIEVYKNSSPESSTLEEVKERILKNEFDVVTFASPSAAMHFSFAVTPAIMAQSKAKIAVIGPTTAAAVKSLGYNTDMEARTSTASGLVEAIETYFRETAVNIS